MRIGPLLGFAVALLHAGEMAPAPLTCEVAPRSIEVGAFYTGSRLKIGGTAAAGSKVIVTITGSRHDERFNRKSRLGPIWISAGRVRITGAPSLLLRFAPEPVSRLLDRETIARRALDEAAVEGRMGIDPSGNSDVRLRADFLALKKSEGTYSFEDSGVAIKQGPDRATYALDLRWPKKAPPAEYEVHVYEVRAGAITRETSAPLPVVRTGFPAWLADTAANRAPVYGVTAVLIGALAGLGIDFVTALLFGKKRSMAH